MEEIKIQLQKDSIPTLWLDAWFIWSKVKDIEFWQKLVKLVLDKKIIVFDTGQLAEILERFKNASDYRDDSKLAISIYKDIVGKYFALDHRTVSDRQIKFAMSSYTQKEQEVVYSFYDLFDDLIQDLTPVLDMRNKLYGEKWGTSRAFKSEVQANLYSDWQHIRDMAKKNNESFDERLRKEYTARYNLVKERIHTEAEYYYIIWKKISNDENALLDFFSSEYYTTIPYVDVYSKLVADLIVGNEPLNKPSDYFDVNIIAVALPFADYMVIDGSMRNRIIDKLKLVGKSTLYKSNLPESAEIEMTLNFIAKM